MTKTLVIVESPAKAKTIGKILGKNYEVAASLGHVRDLPKSQFGVDIENDFQMKYITIRGKGDLIKDLRCVSCLVRSPSLVNNSRPRLFLSRRPTG